MTDQLTQHFKRAEFACNCGCGFNTVDVELVQVLERVRLHYGKPVVINSGCRCASYNARVGGASGSQHLIGRAADIRISGVDPDEVWSWLNPSHHGGLGRYGTFTHIDTRDQTARWAG
ncbi:D-Ala-D-Ala carboxypeptidase family metallohydrolase [Qingshengfaniella alkalisoli]|uniref:DUF882 domain-containing protein n=1 Tax=Qingshengfaniella alkalisoli TaxID=2599296 RepID=A0A5B8J6R1_9RHOB|nr:D-Ala-D-Ala carboxypeptidase family metallohydrolase [Qingshengfaniella alkalisoli]QDY70127.1 DUF882 domain-containing protein [Qingshengfaniella alkalisoli]